MTQNCVCEIGISNLGTPSCTKKTGRPYKITFVNLKDSTGADNKIASGNSLNQATLDALVKKLDTSQRWFVSPEVKNFVSTKGDTVFETYDDGTRNELREGLRTFTGMFKDADSKFLSYLNTVKCAKSGFYIITDAGNIIGYDKDGSGDVYPIPVDVLVNTLNLEQGDAGENVSFQLDIPLTVTDGTLATIYGAEADLVGAEGLIQLSSSATVPATLGYTLTLMDGGQFGSTVGYPDLAIADLVAYNVTTASPATVASVTATATVGVYELTFTGAVATDIVRVSEGQPLLDGGFSFNSVQLDVL